MQSGLLHIERWLNLWTKINDRIIKSGDVYSSCDFQPTQDDIKVILSLGGRTVAKEKSFIMIFNEDGSFKESGPYFSMTNIRFSTSNDREIIDVIKSLGEEFTVQELHEASGINITRIRNTIYGRFRRMKWVEKVGDKKWRLSIS